MKGMFSAECSKFYVDFKHAINFPKNVDRFLDNCD